MAIILNGRSYSAEDFKGYGYLSKFPEQIFEDMLVELSMRGGLSSASFWPAGGIFVGTSAPTLVTHAEWLATGTGYWAWIDTSAASTGPGITGVVSPAAADGRAMPISASATRYVTATIQPARGNGSTGALVAAVQVAGVVTGAIGAASAAGSTQTIAAAASRYAAAAVGSASGSGSAGVLVAVVTLPGVVNAAAAVGSASGAGTASALVSSISRFIAGSVTAAVGSGLAGVISAASSRFMVGVVGSAAGSGSAAQVVATTAAVTPAAPVISSLSASPAQLTVNWGAVSGATSYNIYYRYSGTPSVATHDGVATGVTEAQRAAGFTINGPLTVGTPGTPATYTSICVSAVNAVGEGVLSAAAAAAAAAAVDLFIPFTVHPSAYIDTDIYYIPPSSLRVESGGYLYRATAAKATGTYTKSLWLNLSSELMYWDTAHGGDGLRVLVNQFADYTTDGDGNDVVIPSYLIGLYGVSTSMWSNFDVIAHIDMSPWVRAELVVNVATGAGTVNVYDTNNTLLGSSSKQSPVALSSSALNETLFGGVFYVNNYDSGGF